MMSEMLVQWPECKPNSGGSKGMEEMQRGEQERRRSEQNVGEAEKHRRTYKRVPEGFGGQVIMLVGVTECNSK